MLFFKRFFYFTITLIVIISNGFVSSAMAAKILPLTVYKQMLAGNVDSGWVAFRNYDGKQLVYFSILQTLRCRIKEVRVSFNTTALDNRLTLLPCNEENPFAVPSTLEATQYLYITFDPNSVATAAVQVTWEDDTQSEMLQFRPCKDVGDQTCAHKLN